MQEAQILKAMLKLTGFCGKQPQTLKTTVHNLTEFFSKKRRTF